MVSARCIRDRLKRLENICQQVEDKCGDPQVIDLSHEDLHKSFIQMVKAEGHYSEMSTAIAIPRLREDYNDKWKVVVDIIRRSIKGEAISCEDLIVETFRESPLTLDQPNIAMLTRKVGAVVTTAKGQHGKLTTQEWGRVFNVLKKKLINFQHSLAEETKRELNRELFVDKRMHPTMEDFLDGIGQARNNLRQDQLQHVQRPGIRRQSTREKERTGNRTRNSMPVPCIV